MVEVVSSMQSQFLEILEKDKVPVAVYLMSGIKLIGRIVSSDFNVIILEHNIREGQGTHQLIHKHAIATVLPIRNDFMGEVYREREK